MGPPELARVAEGPCGRRWGRQSGPLSFVSSGEGLESQLLAGVTLHAAGIRKPSSAPLHQRSIYPLRQQSPGVGLSACSPQRFKPRSQLFTSLHSTFSFSLEVHSLGVAREPQGLQTFIPPPSHWSPKGKESTFLSPPHSHPSVQQKSQKCLSFALIGACASSWTDQ